MGWRSLMFTLGAINLAVFCLRFSRFDFREAPKFLVSYSGKAPTGRLSASFSTSPRSTAYSAGSAWRHSRP